mmetsp:Transcript_16929/g.43493  ORF Transcript_16929/g.43493 Transcript_16929/m.43493 type:complete len:89 (+) Transcript_16929:247-513(+)
MRHGGRAAAPAPVVACPTLSSHGNAARAHRARLRPRPRGPFGTSVAAACPIRSDGREAYGAGLLGLEAPDGFGLRLEELIRHVRQLGF